MQNMGVAVLLPSHFLRGDRCGLLLMLPSGNRGTRGVGNICISWWPNFENL